MDHGSGRFLFADAAAGPNKALAVHYHRPSSHGPHDRILVVMSGFDRAAGYFRDCWAPFAEARKILVLAPEFDQASFPGAPDYNYGNVGAAEAMNRPEAWTFGIIDRLVGHAKQAVASDRAGFTLFGHSAGAQFAHRYLALQRPGSAELVIAANAGWYMVPDTTIAYPAGLAGTGFDAADLRRFLSSPLMLLLGDADADENAPDLPKNPEAVAQGPHRLARGLAHFDQCKALAGRLGTPFGWRLVIAAGVGHDDAEVTAAASAVLSAI